MATNSDCVEFSIRLPKPMHTNLKALAKRELSSLNREATIAIRAHLDAAKRGRI